MTEKSFSLFGPEAPKSRIKPVNDGVVAQFCATTERVQIVLPAETAAATTHNRRRRPFRIGGMPGHWPVPQRAYGTRKIF